MSLHEEALARPQRGALRALGGRATEEGFYLAGGTAVAIHLGHRRSVDFDWFTLREGWDPLALAGRLQGSDLRFSTEEVAVGTLVARLGRVQMSFIEYRYPLLGSLTRWPEFGCDLASLDDLATMNLAAVAQRGARRDFVDVYALCVQHRPLLPLLELYGSKYSVSDVAHLLYGLSFFERADRERMPKMLWDVNWRTIKVSIREWVREIAR